MNQGVKPPWSDFISMRTSGISWARSSSANDMRYQLRTLLILLAIGPWPDFGLLLLVEFCQATGL